jgi:hypothetical protein
VIRPPRQQHWRLPLDPDLDRTGHHEMAVTLARCPDRQHLPIGWLRLSLFWSLGGLFRLRLGSFSPLQRPPFFRGGDDRSPASRREPPFRLGSRFRG